MSHGSSFAKFGKPNGERSAKGFSIEQKYVGSEITPTLGDTILGAYVLLKKNRKFFGRNRRHERKKRNPALGSHWNRRLRRLPQNMIFQAEYYYLCLGGVKCASKRWDLYYAFRQAQDKLGSNARITSKKLMPTD
jgi:hypothetical protein